MTKPRMKRLPVDVEPFRVRHEEALQELGERMDEGAGGLKLALLQSDWLDRLLAELRTLLEAETEPVPHSIYATGSYGRQRICPRSDVDLLVVYEPGSLEREALADWCGGLQTLLRDIGFKVGMAARTPEECLELSAEDMTIAASMMDARLLWRSEGAPELPWSNSHLGLAVARVLRRDDGGRSFAEAVREGMRIRHQRSGQTVYWLEPDLKTGHGGLRDLNALEWSAAVLHGVRELESIAERAGAGPEEVALLEEAVSFVLRVRFALHLSLGRFANNRLTFDQQEKIAARFGYKGIASQAPGRGLLPVEQFMQAYYRAAETLGYWSRLWQDIWLLPTTDALPVWVEPGLCVRQGTVDLTRPGDRFAHSQVVAWAVLDEEDAPADTTPVAADPDDEPTAMAQRALSANPLRVFEAALDLDLPIHPMAIVHLSRAARQDQQAADREAMALSLRRMLSSLDASDELIRTLSELGLLTVVLPEFEPIEALAQHDVYHVYTVDAHLRRALHYGKELLRGEAEEGQGMFAAIGRRVPSHRHEVLLLACLLHDVGKGRGGDHSLIGAELAMDIGQRLKLTALQTRHLSFLIEQHLLLPRISQRRDISDEETIREVALKVRTVEVLNDLTLLAVADMKAVGPQNFSPWKAHLLAELHGRVRFALDNGADALWRSDAARGELVAAVSQLLGVWAEAHGEAIETFFATMPMRYLINTHASALARHVRAFAEAAGGEFVRFDDTPVGYTELIVCTTDRPGTLVTIARVLAHHSVNILSAQINTDATGQTLDVFAVQTTNGDPLRRNRRKIIARDIERALHEVVDIQAPLDAEATSGLPPRPTPDIPTVVAVDQKTSRRFTIVEIRTRDRVGLLWAIARYLFGSGHNIHLSKINTEGERVIDVFYVEQMDERRKLTEAEAQDVRAGLQAVLDQLQ